MKYIAVLSVAIVTVALLSFNFLKDDIVPKQAQVVNLQEGVTSEKILQNKFQALTNELRSYHQTNQAHLQKTQQEQARLIKMLVDLDTRLQFVETAEGENIVASDTLTSHEKDMQSAALNKNGQSTESMATDVNINTPNAAEITESDLGYWVDKSLSVGNLDENLTAKFTEQAMVSIENISNVNLDNMQCGERICRATFIQENGEPPVIDDLFGTPPFVNEGFTIDGDDGSVLVYFTQPGVSMDEIRDEAQM